MVAGLLVDGLEVESQVASVKLDSEEDLDTPCWRRLKISLIKYEYEFE